REAVNRRVVILGSGFGFFFQAEDGIRDDLVTGVQTCALPIWLYRQRPLRQPDARGMASFPIELARREVAGSLAHHDEASSDTTRSEERRVGKECRRRWGGDR